MILRLGAEFAWNRSQECRWRQVVLATSAGLALLLVLGACSILWTVSRESARVSGRSALGATDQRDTDLWLLERDDSWESQQYMVLWVEPAGPGEPVLPPGLSRLPDAGEAALSPALARLAEKHPELASRYPNRFEIESGGVRNRSELLAYVRMPEDGRLASHPAAIRVRGFGRPGGDSNFRQLSLSQPPRLLHLALAVGALLVVPGLIMLGIGVAAASSLRESRLQLLHRLGAPPATLLLVGVTEVGLLTVPPMMLVAVAWSVAAARLQSIPLVGHAVFRGDLVLPLWVTVLSVAALTAFAAGAECLRASRQRDRGAVANRAALGRERPSIWRAAPLTASAGLMIGGALLGGYLGSLLLLFGMVLTLAGVTLLAPQVVRPVGQLLARAEAIPLFLAGKRLDWAPAASGRPFAATAAVATLAFGSIGYTAFTRHTPAGRPPPEISAALVRWVGSAPGEIDSLRSAFPSGSVLPLVVDDSGLSIAMSCPQYQAQFGGGSCVEDETFEFPPSQSARFAAAFGDPRTRVRRIPAVPTASVSAALLLDPGSPLSVTRERARTAAMRSVPGPTVVTALTYQPQPRSLTRWIVAGTSVGVGLLALAAVLASIDRLLATRGQRRHLLRIGVTPLRLRSLELMLFVVPYFALVGVGAAVGVVLCGVIASRSSVPMPWVSIVEATGLAVSLGLLGGAAVTLLASTGQRENKPD